MKPWNVIGILLLGLSLAGCTDDVGDASDPAPNPPAVLADNIMTNGTQRLHLPVWPGSEPTVVTAAYRDRSVDWVYYDIASDAVLMLPRGLEEPVKLFDDWGADTDSERNLRTLSAAWLDAGEIHVYIVEDRPDLGGRTQETFGFHAWWSTNGHGSEIINPPRLPDVWDWMAAGLRSDGQEITLALGSVWVTDLFLPTGEERGAVYSTKDGAFGAPAELEGYSLQRAIAWDGDVIACGGRQENGEVAIARRSTQWAWEPVATSAAAMPACDVAANADLKVFYYGLPLVGSGGGGQSGSEDSSEYQVAHLRNGTWEVEKLGRDPFRGQWLMSTQDEHFLVFYAQGEEQNQQVIAYEGTSWNHVLSVRGGDPKVVTTPSHPMMLVDGAKSAAWDHDGFAVLELRR